MFVGPLKIKLIERNSYRRCSLIRFTSRPDLEGYWKRRTKHLFIPRLLLALFYLLPASYALEVNAIIERLRYILLGQIRSYSRRGLEC